MQKQLELRFETASPINAEKFSGQNGLVYEHLKEGRTITTLSAEQLFGIRNLHSRISDLRHTNGKTIYGRNIQAIDRHGIKVKCKEYSLSPFEN